MTTDEQRLLAAWRAGVAYERHNRPQVPVKELATVARSCGWDGELCASWLAGAAGERRRYESAQQYEAG
jgi:hypothetical protein